MNVVLDTSVFIAHESGRRLGPLPAGVVTAVSVMTVAQLRIGVLVADDAATRARRLATLDVATRDHQPLPVDEHVAEHYARLVALARAAGRDPRVTDTLIAATALNHEAAVATQGDEFDELPGVRVIRV